MDLEALQRAAVALAGDAKTTAGDRGAIATRGGWATGSDGIHAALIGEPLWGDSALEATGRTAGHAAALCEAYRRLGTDCLQALGGAFVAAVIDSRRPRLLLAIDRMGQFPLYYAAAGEAVLFGTRAPAVTCHPDADGGLCPQGLFHYLYFHMLPSPVSIFRGVRKLQAAQALVIEPGRQDTVHYWLPAFEEPTDFDQRSAAAATREILRLAVARLAAGDGTGAFLSGGLDSSSVTGMLAKLQPGAASFSIGFDVAGYDEMAYARIAAQHFATTAHSYYVTPEDVLAAVPRVAAAYDEPFGNSSALPAYFCARLAAEHGIHRLLAGDGGDELFGGNARYAKQGVFELWQRIPAALRRGLLEPLAARLPQRPAAVRKVHSYVQQARVPLPERLQSYNFLQRLPLAEMLEADFLAEVAPEAPRVLMAELYRRPQGASTLNRMLYLDWQQTLADNDLRKVRRMCELAGVDVAFPMLDDDLVALSLRVPSRLKIRRGRLRHFYKEAFRGFLPDPILDKTKHGFGLPFGIWLHGHRGLQELAYDSLLRLKRQQMIRGDFLERLIRLHREGHAAYFGELIWVLMVLDLWLAARREAARAAVST